MERILSILIDMCCMPTDLQMIEVCTLKCQLEPQSSRMHFCGDYIKQIHSIERCKTCVMEAAGGRNTLSKTTLSKNEFRLFFMESCVISRDAPLSKIPLLKNYAL